MPTMTRKRDAQYPAERLGDKQCGAVTLPCGALLAVSYGTVIGYVLDEHADRAVWTEERYSVTSSRHLRDLMRALARPVNVTLPAEEFREALQRDTGASPYWNRAPVRFTR